jgi:hypothetical protein
MLETPRSRQQPSEGCVSGGGGDREGQRKGGRQQRSATDKRAMRAAAALQDEDEEEDIDLEDDENDCEIICSKPGDNCYSLSLISASVPLPANAYVASQKQWQLCAQPDTQA